MRATAAESIGNVSGTYADSALAKKRGIQASQCLMLSWLHGSLLSPRA